MTAKNPNAWRECGCGKRMRASNKAGMCGRCRMKAMNAQRCKEYKKRAEGNVFKMRLRPSPTESKVISLKLAREARDKARSLGHDITVMQRDTTPGAWLARCGECGLFVCVDVVEEPQVWGKALDGKCQPQRREAVRLNEYELDYATASASLERAGAGRTYIKPLYWDMDE